MNEKRSGKRDIRWRDLQYYDHVLSHTWRNRILHNHYPSNFREFGENRAMSGFGERVIININIS